MTPKEKALLVSIGSASIDGDLLVPALDTTATAGPGAGGASFFIRSGDRRVRLSINATSPLHVEPSGEGVAVLMGDRTITTGRLEHPLCHCPEQAYITVSERCIYDCRFCPVPKLQGEIKSVEKVLAMVEEACQKGAVKAISLTSGVAESAEREVTRMEKVVTELRDRYDLPIGVSVYPTATSSEDLYAAGADEIKYNVETMDPEIFSRVCPRLSLTGVVDALEHAVRVFGKNRVYSNFIIGLGEDDACVSRGVIRLARAGVIPVLRPISASPLRRGEIVITRPSPERLLWSSRMAREVLAANNLDTRIARTMCLPCTGCDITPFRDV
jgi:biotin synthase-related radical SAM superfamily protein